VSSGGQFFTSPDTASTGSGPTTASTTPRAVSASMMLSTCTGPAIATPPTSPPSTLKSAAYAESVRRMCDAWKGDVAPPAGAYPLSAGAGTACTIDGRPGRLVKSDDGDWLVCKPVNTRTDALPTGPIYDAAEAARIKEAAWREMCAVQDQAWRRR